MLAIAGGKGGVGKTTTALGIGVALASRRRDPVVVDADVDMPNLHIVAGVDDGGVDELAGGTPIDEVGSASPRFDNVRIAGARAGAPVAKALRSVPRGSPVVVDSPAGASADAVLPLRAATHAVVVTTPDPEAIQDATKSAAIARRVGTEVVAWVVNRSSSVPERVRAEAGDGLVLTVPSIEDPVHSVRQTYDEAVTAWVNTHYTRTPIQP